MLNYKEMYFRLFEILVETIETLDELSKNFKFAQRKLEILNIENNYFTKEE